MEKVETIMLEAQLVLCPAIAAFPNLFSMLWVLLSHSEHSMRGSTDLIDNIDPRDTSRIPDNTLFKKSMICVTSIILKNSLKYVFTKYTTNVSNET